MGNLEGRGSDLVTLHVYSPPLKGMTLFHEHQAFFASYDSLYKKVSDRLAVMPGSSPQIFGELAAA